MKREVINRIGHVEFYQACEILKKNKQKFLDERPTLTRTAEMIVQMGGKAMSPRTVAEVKKAGGVEWESKRSMGGKAKGRVGKVLAIALYRLYRKLGEEIPSDLLSVYQEFCKTEQPTSNGVHKP